MRLYRDIRRVYLEKTWSNPVKACLDIWYKEEIGEDKSGLNYEDIRTEAFKLNREKQISALISPNVLTSN